MPTHAVDSHIVYPTDFENMVMGDKHAAVLYVVNGHSEYGWSIRVGARNSSRILNRQGEVKFDNRRYIRHWRFPEAEALEIALRHVDTYHVFWDLNVHEANARMVQRRAARAAVEAAKEVDEAGGAE